MSRGDVWERPDEVYLCGMPKGLADITSMSLSEGGDTVTLYDADDNEIDVVDVEWEPVTEDKPVTPWRDTVAGKLTLALALAVLAVLAFVTQVFSAAAAQARRDAELARRQRRAGGRPAKLARRRPRVREEYTRTVTEKYIYHEN